MAESKPAAYDAVAAGAFVAPRERVKPHTKLIALLALGHFVIDVNQGSLPAMLPFLKQHHALSYAQAAMILLAANLTSSIVQPLFGYLSDQLARRGILPGSLFVSGARIPPRGPVDPAGLRVRLGRRHRAARSGARLPRRARSGGGHGARRGGVAPRGIQDRDRGGGRSQGHRAVVV